MDNLDRINTLADAAPGFVWRLQSPAGNATDIHVFDNPLEILNMSVWESVEHLKAYVYRSDHVEFFRRRAAWFEADAKRVALWHVAPGVLPDVDEGVRRVRFQEAHGPSPYSFGFWRVPEPLTFEVTDLADAATTNLVSRLNEELAAVAVEPDENHFALTTAEVTGSNGLMLRARLDAALVGCGAVRRIESTVGEIKRMFVDRSARRNKIGAAVLDQLELGATRLGMTEVKLETGPRQSEAVAMYERAGYARCEPWGEYLLTPTTSLCYSKPLG
jgi:GNAT superfamily N-acetyltransferase